MKNLLSLKKISSNQLSSNFFSKSLLSRNFCKKSVRENLSNFQRKMNNLVSRQSDCRAKFFNEKLISRNFCAKFVAVQFRDFQTLFAQFPQCGGSDKKSAFTHIWKKFRENKVFTRRKLLELI